MPDLKFVTYTEPITLTTETKSLSDLFKDQMFDLTTSTKSSPFDWSSVILDLTNTSPTQSTEQITEQTTEPTTKQPMPEVKGRIYEVIKDLFASDGVDIYVTSGYRPGSRTVQGRQSRHSTHEAVDFVPMPGGKSTFKDIFRVLNDPNSNTARWLLANGYGYLDETSATGTTRFWHDHRRDHSHCHIGKDSNLVAKYKAKFGSHAV